MDIHLPKQPVLEMAMLRPTASPIPSLLDFREYAFTHSGRSALLLALDAAGVKPGDGVLVPSYHCPTMVSPIERLGATPVFYPLGPTLAPNLTVLQSATRPTVRAMIAVHLFGRQADLAETSDFCRAHDIALIEDCAHCFFGQREGVPVGSTGMFAIGSLPKFFPVASGGILISNHQSVPQCVRAEPVIRREAQAAWRILHHAAEASRLGQIGAVVRGIDTARLSLRKSPPKDVRPQLHLSPVAVRVAALSDPLLEPMPLPRIEQWVVSRTDHVRSQFARRRNFRRLTQALNGLAMARPLFSDCGDDSAPYVMPLHLRTNPDAAYLQMRNAGLPVFRWDRTWPQSQLYTDHPTADWARHLVQVACHQSLRDEDVDAMAQRLRSILAMNPTSH